jgi:hypothetical protein
MWARSLLPPVPPCQRSAPGVESKATTLPTTSSLLISPPKVASHFSASGNSDDEKCLLRSTCHVLLQSLGLGSMGVAQQSGSAHWSVVLWSIRHVQRGSWDGNAIRQRERHKSAPLLSSAPRSTGRPDATSIAGQMMDHCRCTQRNCRECQNTLAPLCPLLTTSVTPPAAPSANSEMAEHNHNFEVSAFRPSVTTNHSSLPTCISHACWIPSLTPCSPHQIRPLVAKPLAAVQRCGVVCDGRHGFGLSA